MKDNKAFYQWANKDDSYRYLPDEIKDFHDQKDLFKEIFRTYGVEDRYDITWVDAHCFVIDTFLWHMARKGYKLQKIRGKAFNSIVEKGE